MMGRETLTATLPPPVFAEGGLATNIPVIPGTELTPTQPNTMTELGGGVDMPVAGEYASNAEAMPEAEALGRVAVSTLMDNEGLDTPAAKEDQSFFDREFKDIVDGSLDEMKGVDAEDTPDTPDDTKDVDAETKDEAAETADDIDAKAKDKEDDPLAVDAAIEDDVVAADIEDGDVAMHALVAAHGAAGKVVARRGGRGGIGGGRRGGGGLGGGRRRAGRRRAIGGGGVPGGPVTARAAVAPPPPRAFEWLDDWYSRNNTDWSRNTRWAQSWSRTDAATGLATGWGEKEYTMFGRRLRTGRLEWLNFYTPMAVDQNGNTILNRDVLRTATVKGHGATSRNQPSEAVLGDPRVYDHSDWLNPAHNEAIRTNERAYWASPAVTGRPGTIARRGWRTNIRTDSSGNAYRARSWLFSVARNNRT